MMSSGVRAFALTVHVICSVGWMGAVAAFLALAMAGLASTDEHTATASYVAMNVSGWFVIVPLSVASLLTGLVQSIGTPWGLFRHYWVVFKLAINVVASVLLLAHMQPVGRLAHVAAAGTGLGAPLGAMRLQVALDAALALLALGVATALAVYKPRGVTRYGWRVLHRR